MYDPIFITVSIIFLPFFFFFFLEDLEKRLFNIKIDRGVLFGVFKW